MNIFISRSGQTFGPYDWPGIHAMLLAGQLSPSDLAWTEGEGGWVPLSQLALSHPPAPQPAPTTQLPSGAPPLPSVPPSAPPPPPPTAPPAFPPFPGSGTQPPLPPVPGGGGGSAFPSDPGVEQVIFDTSASPIALSMRDLALGLLCTGGLWCLYVVALNLTTRYRLTNQRLTLRSGIISQKVEEIEVYRVRDVTVEQETMGRLLGFGDVIVHASDASSPRLVLRNVMAPMRVKEQVRAASRQGRRTEGVRATEFMP